MSDALPDSLMSEATELFLAARSGNGCGAIPRIAAALMAERERAAGIARNATVKMRVIPGDEVIDHPVAYRERIATAILDTPKEPKT